MEFIQALIVEENEQIPSRLLAESDMIFRRTKDGMVKVIKFRYLIYVTNYLKKLLKN